MAPERVSGDAYDGRADVYSVGVMLYEMLTGALPFVSRDGGYWAVAMMHVSREPEAPSKVLSSITRTMDDLVLRTLSKDPGRRPSAKELASALRSVQSTAT